jgi:hypothetical protein
MVKLFRILIIGALVLLLVAAVIPLGRPVQVTVSLNQALPLWLVASIAMLPIGLATLVASGGLFFFKQWGRWLGLMVVASGAVVAFFVTGSPTSSALSSVAVALVVLSALFWVVGLLASCHPAVLAKFRHER